jgi:hypothetical protein
MVNKWLLKPWSVVSAIDVRYGSGVDENSTHRFSPLCARSGNWESPAKGFFGIKE